MAEQLSPELINELQEIGRLPTDQQKKLLPAFLSKLTPGQMEFLKKQQQPAKAQCIFCKIINKEIPAEIVYEDDFILAFLDIKPANPGHVLVIPKTHYQFLTQMPDDETEKLFIAVRNVSQAVFDATGADGVGICQRNGETAGQVVPHVHVHVIPRFKNDGIRDDWIPKELEKEQFEEMRKRISANLSSVSKQEAPKKKSKLFKFPTRLP